VPRGMREPGCVFIFLIGLRLPLKKLKQLGFREVSWYNCDEWGPTTIVQGGLVPNKISGVGTSFGQLVDALPGPNKQCTRKLRALLS
jgi:hypothetical protein